MRRSHSPCLACLLAPLLLGGCMDYVWMDYQDDPYLAASASDDLGDILRNVNSPNASERQVALRLTAQRAAEARRRGDTREADRLEQVIIRRYGLERTPAVRSCIIRICVPVAGRGSRQMIGFLRGRIASGEYAGYAALSLAMLAPKTAFEDIEPLTRHPDPEVRYQAAEALVVLGDPRGYGSVARVWQWMGSPTSPAMIGGVPSDEAREALAKRAGRAFGKALRAEE